ncbi:MAG: hypothetical protein MJ196_07595 [Treponemataceae bacterium]|nr:hypothetical protein [Treponemataceae bacterium]
MKKIVYFILFFLCLGFVFAETAETEKPICKYIITRFPNDDRDVVNINPVLKIVESFNAVMTYYVVFECETGSGFYAKEVTEKQFFGEYNSLELGEK